MSHTILSILFWCCVFFVFYTNVGYVLLITLLAQWHARPLRWTQTLPSVSLIIPAYNEEFYLKSKLDNSLSMAYPGDRLEVLVVADGSTDQTCEIARSYSSQGVRLLYRPQRLGKATALNYAAAEARGDVLVFTDANAILSENAVRRLVRNFGDDHVAAVAGAKHVFDGDRSAAAIGESLYWRYESWLKRCDSRVSSIMGAAGELLAVRRDRFIPFEKDAIIEDFVLSFRLIEAGWRVVYEPEAIAYEEGAASLATEWVRRTRIAAGGFQSIARLKGMLHPRLGVIAWQYLSHRVLRWAITPFALMLAFVLNLALLSETLYRVTFILQVLFYGLALVGYMTRDRFRRFKPAVWALYFCFANLAAIVGFVRAIRKTQSVMWARVR